MKLKKINYKEKDVVEVLNELTNMEINLMQERTMYSYVRMPRFLFIVEFEDFNFEFQSSINKEKILDLKNLRYIEKKKIYYLEEVQELETHI